MPQVPQAEFIRMKERITKVVGHLEREEIDGESAIEKIVDIFLSVKFL